MRNLTIILTVILILTGCSADMYNIKSDRKYKTEFLVNEGYQSSYRNILEQTRDCFTSPFIPFLSARMTIDGDLYHDNQSGVIRVIGDFYDWYMINLDAVSETQTKITLRCIWDKANEGTRRIEQFAKRTAVCSDFK